MGSAQEWLVCCETPCKSRLFGFESIKNTDLPKFNQLVKEKSVDAIILKKKDAAM